MADFTLHPGRMAELLAEPFVLEELERRAAAISSAAGPGHRVESEPGSSSTRARVAVITDDVPAMLRERKSRNLTRAIDAGRDS